MIIFDRDIISCKLHMLLQTSSPWDASVPWFCCPVHPLFGLPAFYQELGDWFRPHDKTQQLQILYHVKYNHIVVFLSVFRSFHQSGFGLYLLRNLKYLRREAVLLPATDRMCLKVVAWLARPVPTCFECCTLWLTEDMSLSATYNILLAWGDTMVSLAIKRGFSVWACCYEHSQNPALTLWGSRKKSCSVLSPEVFEWFSIWCLLEFTREIIMILFPYHIHHTGSNMMKYFQYMQKYYTKF